MNPIDQHKLIFILKDTTQRLHFIGKLQRDNDISSELAGFEQSKLLTDQQKLEQDYAVLVGQRSKLLGITNRVQLLATQEEIKQVAKNLKESTKKLCRLFKENPNIDADSQKVYKERAELIYEFETLIQLVQTGQLKEFANKVTASLEQQDSLRKFAAREKELIAEIRRLQNEKTQEYNEYQKEQNEKQKNIQLLKERLLYKTQRAEQQKKYDEKVAGAQENTQQRIFQYKQQDIEAQITFYTNKIANEELVHKELKIYLDRKTNEAETLTKQQNQLAEDQRVILDDKIEKLTEYKTKMLEELDILKRRFEKEEIEKQEKERKELEDREQKIRNELQQIRLENAIKLIQNELMERKELYGLGAKKKKPKKKK